MSLSRARHALPHSDPVLDRVQMSLSSPGPLLGPSLAQCASATTGRDIMATVIGTMQGSASRGGMTTTAGPGTPRAPVSASGFQTAPMAVSPMMYGMAPPQTPKPNTDPKQPTPQPQTPPPANAVQAPPTPSPPAAPVTQTAPAPNVPLIGSNGAVIDYVSPK